MNGPFNHQTQVRDSTGWGAGRRGWDVGRHGWDVGRHGWDARAANNRLNGPFNRQNQRGWDVRAASSRLNGPFNHHGPGMRQQHETAGQH
ncbi:hypothetical protein GCM10010428_80210 [Actinosynnema pretiosum subsp. pretiosum]